MDSRRASVVALRLAELRCSLRVRKNWLDLGREDSSGGRRCTRGAHPPKAGLVQVRRLGLLDDQSVGGGPCGGEWGAVEGVDQEH